jgi:hypothetical protein
MCTDLEVELDRGKQAAVAMAQHLFGMGAAKSIIPVELDGEKFEVVVRHVCHEKDGK